LFFEEELGQAEAAAGKFPGVVVADQGDTFFADLGEENLPCLIGYLLGTEFEARLLGWSLVGCSPFGALLLALG
jgi:hypothetical protein